MFQELYICDNIRNKRNKYIEQYGLDQLQLFSDYIYEKLMDLIKQRLRTFINNDLIKTEIVFYTDVNTVYSAQEITSIEQEILDKNNWTNKNWMYNYPKVQAQFFRERNQLFQQRFHTKESLIREEYHIIPGLSEKVKEFTPLTHEEQIQTLYVFSEYFKARLMYQAKNHICSPYTDFGQKIPKDIRIGLYKDTSLTQRYTWWSLPQFENLLVMNKSKYINLDTFLSQHFYQQFTVNNIRYLK